MFSQRRIRVLAATALVTFILYLYYSGTLQGDSQSVQNQKFYQSTVTAINAEKEAAANIKTGGHLPNADKEHPSFKPSEEYTYFVGDDQEQPAIPRAQPDPQQQLEISEKQDTEEISIAGRTKMAVYKEKGRNGEGGTYAETEAVPVEGDEDEKEKQQQQQLQQLEDEHKATKAELNDILKRSPIIIFSKSYCPYSKKAKTILLDRYSIIPTPFVVELDQHQLGPQLQSLLGENTGRRTVPNVLVNGRSIGGGDDIVALDEHDELASRLKSLAGKWLQEVQRKET
ncbi:glutaredoxin [Aspergillus mulundensis]|uniref:Glutaredoxin domain-containing protein n=1 Tax=Aspergillus mulundensis TaxID=1810919 RepID=A0A3D8RQG2_9EURO|nr:Uncharacterized protein DSM5745_06227 [Aspergillus mulundensis]RDW76235.1 Uncharacterized protein DSM5745_06227 [Aspergillus mulundensis]